jgi:DNA-binding HxlR family transcriptional regulator
MTEKMLSQQLRELEEDNILPAKYTPKYPPRVEYAFTDLGKELASIFYALEKWGSHFMTATDSNGTVKNVDATCYTYKSVVEA